MYYIASPFFDDNSRYFVETKETDYSNSHIDYYSPREDGLNFNELKNPELRSSRIKTIFGNNVSHIKLCDNMICNLYECNGSTDIGTLWELGYFVGLNPDTPVGLYGSQCTIDLVMSAISKYRELVKLPKSSESNLFESTLDLKSPIIKIVVPSNIINKFDNDNLDLDHRLSDNLIGSIMGTHEYINSSDIFKLRNCDLFILTDDHPMESFILMGILYSMNIGYYTLSLKNYGSNIMIAASSKGHLSLPGIVDDTYRINLQ